MRHRPGWSLMEVLIVCTLTTAATILGCQLLLVLQQTDRATRDEVSQLQAVGRMTRQFRDDAHAAQAVALAADCRFDVGGGRRIVYRLVGASRERSLERIVESEAGRISAREAYRLPDFSTVQFSERKIAERPFVTVHISAEPDLNPNPTAARPLSFTAGVKLFASAPPPETQP